MRPWFRWLARRRDPAERVTRCVVCRREFRARDGVYVPGAGLCCSQACADDALASYAW